jgi:hypothetical protein
MTTAITPSAPAAGTPLFFCPNCRWDRMVTGKCKRKSEAFLRAQTQSMKRLRKRKEKMRKPVEERRASQGGGANPSSTEQAIDGLVEFFTSLSAQQPTNQPGEAGETTSPEPRPQGDNASNNPDEIRELEDMGALARDLIRRIQRLRDQFRPGSLAALALPDIRVEGEGSAATAQRMAQEAMAIQLAADLLVPPRQLVATANMGNVVAAAAAMTLGPGIGETPGFQVPPLLEADPFFLAPDADPAPAEEFDDEDDAQFELNESSTE